MSNCVRNQGVAIIYKLHVLFNYRFDFDCSIEFKTISDAKARKVKQTYVS